MKSFFEDDAYNEITQRLNHLSETSTAQWGKMTVAQMLHHCQKPLHIILGNDDYGLKPSWFLKLLFKKSLYSDKPWRMNAPTAPSFKVSTEKEFTTEKNNLALLLEALHDQRHNTEWRPHPVFGKFTKDQWGKMQYKHLDHHFKQFGWGVTFNYSVIKFYFFETKPFRA